MSFRPEGRPGHLLRTSLIAGAAVVAFMVAKDGCGGDPGVQITPGSTVEHIEPSDAVPLIDIFGSASATASEDSNVPKFVPFIGGDKVPGTGRSVEATVNGVVEIRTEQNAVDYSTYTMPGASTKDKPESGILVKVNADSIYMRPSMSPLIVDGKPVVEFRQELLGLSTGEGVLKRGALAGEGAKLHFIWSCGKQVLSTLKAGVINRAKLDIDKAAGIPVNLPGGDKEAALMRQMARKEIKVIFTQGTAANAIDANKIKLRYQDTTKRDSPIVPIPGEQAGFNKIKSDGDDAENVKIEPGKNCTFTGNAAKELYELSGKGAAPGL